MSTPNSWTVESEPEFKRPLNDIVEDREETNRLRNLLKDQYKLPVRDVPMPEEGNEMGGLTQSWTVAQAEYQDSLKNDTKEDYESLLDDWKNKVQQGDRLKVIRPDGLETWHERSDKYHDNPSGWIIIFPRRDVPVGSGTGSDFVDTLKHLDSKLTYTIEENARESPNVEDRRKDVFKDYVPPGGWDAPDNAGFKSLLTGFAGWLGTQAQDVYKNMETCLYSTDKDEKTRASAELAATFASGGLARGTIEAGGKIGGAADELGIFGGKMAQQKAGLEIAQEAESRGFSNKQIQDATGWFKSAEGQWKFHISDEGLAWRKGFDPKEIQPPLFKLIDHPQFFREYPNAVDDIVVTVDSRLKPGDAHFISRGGPLGEIAMHPSDIGTEKGRSVLVHELQHWVQKQEGFPRGSSPQEYMVDTTNKLAELFTGTKTVKQMTKDDKQFVNQLTSLLRGKVGGETPESMIAIISEMRTKDQETYRKLVGSLTRHMSLQRYYNQAGEVEARLVQDMLNMSKKEIDKMDFSTAGDVPLNQRQANFNRDVKYSVKEFSFTDVTAVDRLKKLENTELLPMLEIKLKSGLKAATDEYSKLKPGRPGHADPDLIADRYVLMNLYQQTEKIVKDMNKPGVQRDHMRRYLDMLLENISNQEIKLESRMIPQKVQQQQGKVPSDFVRPERPSDWQPGGNTRAAHLKGEYIILQRNGLPVGSASSLEQATRAVNKRDNAHGSVKYMHMKTKDYLDQKWSEIPDQWFINRDKFMKDKK